MYAQIEKYKNGLDKELEQFKSELNRIDPEHEIKYSRLHEERAQKVKELHDLLYEAKKKLRYLTSTNQGPEWVNDHERTASIEDKIRDLIELLELNRIYFPEYCVYKLKALLGNVERLLEI